MIGLSAMGILFVLLFLGTLGLILASVGALFIRGFVNWLTRRANTEVETSARKRLVRNTTVFPFGCLAWAALIFIFQGCINTICLHRDIGLGDSYYCPLPNGYSLLMIDVDDQGTVYNPKTQDANGSVGDQSDAVSGVTKLQISGSTIFGASDSRSYEHFGQSASLDRYFLLDTRIGKHADFSNEDALRAEASKSGITLKLEPIFKVYKRYRYTWFDGVTVMLLIVPTILTGGLHLRSAMRLRAMANS
jgi:hypothetical protein